MTTIANFFNFKRNRNVENLAPDASQSNATQGNFPVLQPTGLVSPEIIHTEPVRRDLGRWGWEEASKTLGMATALENCLQLIRQRLFVQHAADARMVEEHQAHIASLIAEEEKAINNADARNKEIAEVDLPAIKQEREKLKKRKEELAKQGDLLVFEAGYSRTRHIVLATVLILATIGVYLFYVSLVYTAFFRSYLSEATGADITTIEALLNSVFSSDHIFQLDNSVIFPWIVAALFFGFGLLAHRHNTQQVTSAWKKIFNVKYGFLLIALALDVVLAFKLERNIESVRAMTGLDNPHASIWSNMNFWIVVIIGFLGYLACASLFDYLLQEIRKKNPDVLIRKELLRLDVQGDELDAQEKQLKAESIQLEAQVQNHRHNIAALKAREKNAVFSPAAMLVDMRHFYEGWLKFIAQDENDPEKLQAAQAAFARATQGLTKNEALPELN